MNGPKDNNRRVYGVSELTRLIKAALEARFGALWVEGELSNVRRPASGHLYFTLKDETSQIAAVLFRGDRRRLTFQPRDGQQVRLYGELTVYERGGNYQIIVRQMEQGGQGALQARFEALKEKLKAEGLFDPARKRPLPMLPQHVGIVTSATGAAIRDILNVLMRRFPNVHVLLAPARVQGEGAAAEIAAQIEALNRVGGLDVLIVGRGGGSLEDLWCFNEEVVARAVAGSRIPVISAVGHEIDFTISDFVADLRAPTPSAAAELVVGRKDVFEQMLGEMTARLVRALREQVLRARNRLLTAAGSPVFRAPEAAVQSYRQRIDSLGMRMCHELRGAAREARQRVDDSELRMTHVVRMRMLEQAQTLRRLESHLRALSPLAVLQRGYSVTCDADGRVLKSVSGLAAGARVHTRLADGSFESEVTAKHDQKTA